MKAMKRYKISVLAVLLLGVLPCLIVSVVNQTFTETNVSAMSFAMIISLMLALSVEEPETETKLNSDFGESFLSLIGTLITLLALVLFVSYVVDSIVNGCFDNMLPSLTTILPTLTLMINIFCYFSCRYSLARSALHSRFGKLWFVCGYVTATAFIFILKNIFSLSFEENPSLIMWLSGLTKPVFNSNLSFVQVIELNKMSAVILKEVFLKDFTKKSVLAALLIPIFITYFDRIKKEAIEFACAVSIYWNEYFKPLVFEGKCSEDISAPFPVRAIYKGICSVKKNVEKVGYCPNCERDVIPFRFIPENPNDIDVSPEDVIENGMQIIAKSKIGKGQRFDFREKGFVVRMNAKVCCKGTGKEYKTKALFCSECGTSLPEKSLHPRHMPHEAVKNVVIIGPEYSGKTTLCAALSKFFYSPLCGSSFEEKYFYKLRNNTIPKTDGNIISTPYLTIDENKRTTHFIESAGEKCLSLAEMTGKNNTVILMLDSTKLDEALQKADLILRELPSSEKPERIVITFSKADRLKHLKILMNGKSAKTRSDTIVEYFGKTRCKDELNGILKLANAKSKKPCLFTCVYASQAVKLGETVKTELANGYLTELLEAVWEGDEQ